VAGPFVHLLVNNRADHFHAEVSMSGFNDGVKKRGMIRPICRLHTISPKISGRCLVAPPRFSQSVSQYRSQKNLVD